LLAPESIARLTCTPCSPSSSSSLTSSSYE
jgi:hypothetical protein